jgi:hypothetical protein
LLQRWPQRRTVIRARAINWYRATVLEERAVLGDEALVLT